MSQLASLLLAEVSTGCVITKQWMEGSERCFLDLSGIMQFFRKALSSSFLLENIPSSARTKQ